MKYFTFYRESNNFDDIIKNPEIKKRIKVSLEFSHHLMLGIDDSDKLGEAAVGYLILMFGENIVTPTKDFSPVIGKDYIPADKHRR